MSRRAVTQVTAFAALLALASCKGAPDDASITRGRGLQPAGLAPAAEAAVIDAAARASFDVGPGLVLLLHPRRLPRTAGTTGGDSVPPALVAALRARGTIQGGCDPVHDTPRDTPRCGGQRTGYVIRASPVLRMAGDSVELYFAAEVFGPDRGPRPVAVRFEKIYQLLPEGAAWRVAREARVHDSP